MKITSNQNIVRAIESQDGITDRNLPVYLTGYAVYVATQHASKAAVLWSTVSFLPSYQDFQRILNIHLAVSVLEPFGPVISSLEDLTFVFDFSAFADFLREQFYVTIDGPLEGNISFDGNAKSFNANRYMDYLYREGTQELTLTLKNLDVVPPSFPATIYMNISIRDDIDDPENDAPALFPLAVADEILRMPPNTSRGDGIRVVLLLLICCPEELKTLQISQANINDPEAFNPTDEIEWLLQRQGIPLPALGLDFRFQPADTYPIMGDDVVAAPWKLSFLMTHINFEMQNLYSNLPDATVIVLYDWQPDSFQPSFMSWLGSNTSSYDIIAVSQAPLLGGNWGEAEFSQTQQFYDNIIETIALQRKPFISSTFNEGTNERITYPNGTYIFMNANTRTLTMGAFELLQDRATERYLIEGPYKAGFYSNGGYCNRVLRPAEQFDFVYSPNYGSPDFSGYDGPYLFCLDYGYPYPQQGSSWSPQPLAALFGKIYKNTLKRDWDFKFILERKGLTLCTYIVDGHNRGTDEDDRYYCTEFFFWNPVVGFGNLWYTGFYNMCNLILNNTYVQISNVGLNNQLSFMNVMPRNTFNDFIFRQPVFGSSSIFSFFKIYVATGQAAPSSDQFNIFTGTPVYFVDISERYALSYGFDEDAHLYVFLQHFNYGSSFQEWRLQYAENPSVIRAIFAFDNITIVPNQYPQQFLSSLWNANNSRRPASPSIRTTGPGPSEIFVLNTDPTLEENIAKIVLAQSDDTFNYSYYVNFTYQLPNNELLYLTNPQHLSIEPPLDDPDAIYVARNEVHAGQMEARWGYFEKYPQWILVPLNIPYDSPMFVNRQYMIFNTVVNAYLYLDRDTQMFYLNPVAADITDRLAFTEFIFTIERFQQFNLRGPLFVPQPTNRPGIPFNKTADYNICNTTVKIFNQQMLIQPFNGNYRYFSWDAPKAYDDPLVALASDDLPDTTTQIIKMFWVFKRYMVDFSRVNNIIAFNGQPTPQENNGLAITSDADPNNLNFNAPSLTNEVNSQGALWQFACDTFVTDQYSAEPGFDSRYIVIDENLKQSSQTNLRFVSLAATIEDLAIGVNGANPQPRLTEFVPSSPDQAVLWSVTSVNQFTPPPQKLQRSNYFYAGMTYSFYSYVDALNAGYMSSARAGGTPGWQPSTIPPNITFGVLKGNANTIFTIV